MSGWATDKGDHRIHGRKKFIVIGCEEDRPVGIGGGSPPPYFQDLNLSKLELSFSMLHVHTRSQTA